MKGAMNCYIVYLLIGDNFVVPDKLFVKYSIVFELDNKVVQTLYPCVLQQ